MIIIISWWLYSAHI